jgi:hypothetical protein
MVSRPVLHQDSATPRLRAWRQSLNNSGIRLARAGHGRRAQRRRRKASALPRGLRRLWRDHVADGRADWHGFVGEQCPSGRECGGLAC